MISWIDELDEAELREATEEACVDCYDASVIYLAAYLRWKRHQ